MRIAERKFAFLDEFKTHHRMDNLDVQWYPLPYD